MKDYQKICRIATKERLKYYAIERKNAVYAFSRSFNTYSSLCPGSMKNSRRRHDHRSKECKKAIHRQTNNAERHNQNPNDRIEHERQQR